MKRVSVRTARMHLRQLLDDVASGQEVELLRRGKPVARLVPPPRRSAALVLPSLREFRASVRGKGGTVSAEVVKERRRARY
jgi:prevent-host-death family protein